MKLSADEQWALYECLKTRFNLDEVTELAFRLAIVYQNFDLRLDAFCRELVQFVVRQERVPDLLRAMRDRRHLCPALGPLFARVLAGEQRTLELAYLRQRLAAPDHFIGAERYTPLEGSGEVRVVKPRPTLMPDLTYIPGLDVVTEAAERMAGQPREPRHFSDVLQAVAELGRVVLLGDPGAGKTTALRTVELARLKAALDDEAAPLPLYLPLGEWTKADEPLRAFMAGQLGPLGAYLDSLLEKRAVLLLDGLNEIPTAQREEKAGQIRVLLRAHPTLTAVVSCREQDYPTLDLKLDRLLIAPLEPGRVRDFAARYLGAEAGVSFFWRLGGGAEVAEVAEVWQRAGATFEQFWTAPDIPREGPNVYSKTTVAQDTIWKEQVHDGAANSLLRLASNPYMLIMLLEVYDKTETLPENRGDLFATFAHALLGREKLVEEDVHTGEQRPTAEGAALLGALARLAFAMQVHRAAGDADAVIALPLAEVVPTHLSERELYLARCTALLVAEGGMVRFSHQLLQEYFAATHMQGEIAAGRLNAAALWPRGTWGKRTGWEEATILLAGLHSDDCTAVLKWVAEANPEIAVQCVARSGATTPAQTREWLRTLWLPRLTDTLQEPDPCARAALGRALTLADLDNRPGVGLRPDGLPDILWCEVSGGDCQIGGDEKAWSSLPAQVAPMPTFWMAAYPVTNRQFQAFAEMEDGYRVADWWEGLERRPVPPPPRWSYANHPRERVNWYEAVAFCRWLTAKLGYVVRLPTEQEWERAARGLHGRIYPWGEEYISGYANINETGGFGPYALQQTSAVGIYPQGVSPEGCFDLSGNVWEWTLTDWASGSSDETMESAARVLRGASWFDDEASVARGASRDYVGRGFVSDDRGFRVAAPSAPPGAPPHGGG